MVKHSTQSNNSLTVAVKKHTWQREIKPVVSIVCITFNHENFVEEAIESFLLQETSFPVEILIHDDASTDKTAEIVKHYAEQYPGLIKIVLQKENQYSKGVDPEWEFLYPIAKGKYIALCEGDDYWTDPYKLLKQVEILEQNPDYAVCVGGYSRLEDHSGIETPSIEKREGDSSGSGFEFSLSDMKEKWLTKTLTALFKRELLDEFNLSVYRHNRDIHLFYHLLKGRKGFYLTECIGVYRIHEGGINSMKAGIVNNTKAYNCYKELYENNRDEFTRIMHLKHTLNLLNYAFYNSDANVSFSKLYLEALKLVRRRKEIRWLFTVFMKASLKANFKKIIA